jgi:hypothetical protein
MQRGSIFLLAVFMALAIGTISTMRGAAQVASPVAAECVAPDLPPGTPTPPEASPAAGAESEEGEGGSPPSAPANGAPADEATTQAVIAAAQNTINCINGGDYLGVAALITQSFQEDFLGFTNPYDVPIAFEDAGPMEVIRIDNVQIYEDGTVSVDYVYGGFIGAPTSVTSERWFFVQEDGIYKVDNILPNALPEGVLPGAVVVDVVMVDFAFYVEPKTIPTGTPVIFRIVNQMASTTGHVTALVTYPEGTTAEQIIAGDVDAMEASTGFLNGVYFEPGEAGDMAFTSLDAGTYFLVCDVGTEAGHLHFELGMVSQITVE